MNKTSSEILNLKHKCDDLLRGGQFKLAQDELLKLSTVSIPRSQIADLAALARRAHLWKLSLKWLHPIIRPQFKESTKANPREVAEYAMALQKAGALREADELLASVDPALDSRVLLSRAYLRMAQWDYASAETFLSAYVQSESISDYERLIGKINWLACLVYLKDLRARALMAEVEHEARKGDHLLLLSNLYEISAQNFVADRNWSDANRALSEAQALVDQEKNLDALFIEKWRTIASAMKSGNPGELSGFRKRALQLQHWETLRDLDFYQAFLEPDSHWTAWVYFGTPHLAFRKRLETIRNFPEQAWIQRSSEASIEFDPWFPKDREGDLPHRCLVLLLKDLYRPLRVAEAFGALFPDEYYNPESSPNRVHQAMKRTRVWLEKIGTSFQLVEDEGAYSLRTPEKLKIFSRKPLLNLEDTHFFFERYRGLLPTEFTAEELVEPTGKSLSSLQRMIKAALEKEVLMKIGQGRFTAYKFRYSSKF